MDEITRNKIRETLEREFKSHDVKEEVTDSFIDGLVAEVKTDMDSEFTPGAVVTTYNDSIDLLSTEIFDQIKNGGNFKKVDELQQEQNRIRYKLIVYKCMYEENTESLPDLPYEDELSDILDSGFSTEKKEDTDLDTISDSDIGFDVLKDDEEPEDKNKTDFDGEEDLFGFETPGFGADNDTDENDDGFSFDEFDSDDEDSDFLKDCGLDNSFDDTNWNYNARIIDKDHLCLNVRQGKYLKEQMNISLKPSEGLDTIKKIITDHLFDSLDVEKCMEIILSLKLNDDGISWTSARLLDELGTAEENIKTLKKLFGFTNKLCN